MSAMKGIFYLRAQIKSNTSSDLDEIWHMRCPQKLSDCKLHKNWHCALREWTHLHTYFPHLLPHLGKIQYKGYEHSVSITTVLGSKLTNYVTRMDTVWYDSLLGQRQTANCVTLDRNSRNSIWTDKENTRLWPKNCIWTITFLPRLIWWLGHKANLLFWHCQTQQEGHTTGLRAQENDTPKWWPSSTDEGWLHSNTMEGQTWRTNFDKHLWCISRG